MGVFCFTASAPLWIDDVTGVLMINDGFAIAFDALGVILFYDGYRRMVSSFQKCFE
jgi:hypothetical protein